MSFIEYAKREFLAAGYKPVDQCEEDPNKWIQENVLELLKVFSDQGHSGASAPFCIDLFSKLAKFEPLTPLSGNDSEWIEVGEGTFQNNRCGTIFKKPNGIAYNLNGFVFWHWAERELYEDEEGYVPEGEGGFPATTKFKTSFTSQASLKLVEFPYVIESPEHIEVICYEVNKDTGEREPGSGRWHTEYPDCILRKSEEIQKLMNANT